RRRRALYALKARGTHKQPPQPRSGRIFPRANQTAAPGGAAVRRSALRPAARAWRRGRNSMGRKGRRFLLDRRLGRDRGLRRLRLLLVPLDRFGLAHESARENLVHARNRDDLQVLLDAVVDLHEVLRIILWDQHRLDAATGRRKQLFLETADRQDTA